MKCEFKKMQFAKKSPNRGGLYRWCELWILWKDDDFKEFKDWFEGQTREDVINDYCLLFEVSGWEDGKITEQSYISDIGINDMKVDEDCEFYKAFCGGKEYFKQWYEHNYWEVIPDD